MDEDDRRDDFTAFASTRYRSLVRTAYLLTGDLPRGEDLVQTALVKAYLAWPRLRRPDAAEAYVRKVMVTTNISWWRRRWHGEVPTDELPERLDLQPSPSDRVDERAGLWPLLATLPPRQRTALVLRFYEDLSVEQAAAEMHCSVGAVKSTTARALAALRGQLDAAPTEGIR